MVAISEYEKIPEYDRSIVRTISNLLNTINVLVAAGVVIIPLLITWFKAI